MLLDPHVLMYLFIQFGYEVTLLQNKKFNFYINELK